jgi:hypothetical protein
MNFQSAFGQLEDGWKVEPISAEAFSVACFEQPIRLTGQLARIRRIDYIYVNAWGGGHSPFIQFYEKAKARGWRTHEMACGHDVMIDDPAALTALLLSVAN